MRCFIVNSNAWLYIALITTDLYEISCYIGPRFRGILRNYVCPQYVWNNLLGYAEIVTYQTNTNITKHESHASLLWCVVTDISVIDEWPSWCLCCFIYNTWMIKPNDALESYLQFHQKFVCSKSKLNISNVSLTFASNILKRRTWYPIKWSHRWILVWVNIDLCRFYSYNINILQSEARLKNNYDSPSN